MKSISFVNHYPKYELLSADWTVPSYENLDMRSIVKIFSERTDNVPLAQVDYSSGLEKRGTKIKTSFWDEGDR